MEKQKIFQVLDFYAFRTTLLPAEVYRKKLTSSELPLRQQLQQLAKKPLIREAIAVSSISLYNALDSLSAECPSHKREQTEKAFLLYLIRMTARPTPFGLFSGVTYGTYGKNYSFTLNNTDCHKKYTRPDMGWLLSIIGELEKKKEIILQLPLISNKVMYRVGSKIKIPYLTRCGNEESTASKLRMERLSIHSKPTIEKVLEYAASPITGEKLVILLQQDYGDAEQEQIKEFVLQMVQQELLISSLRPPLLNTDPLAYILEKITKLKGVEGLSDSLREIQSLLKEYDDLPLGKGEKMYCYVRKKMKEIRDSKNLLQVDLALSSSGIHLPQSVKEDIETIAEVIWKLSNSEFGLPHIRQYQNAFIEKYGMDREIPVLELLDEDMGLGAPASYEYPKSRRKEDWKKSSFQRRRDYLFSQWLMTALMKGEQELVLDDSRIDELNIEEMDTRCVPRSFELYFNLSSPSKEALEAGDYRLMTGSSPGSYGAGKSMGRFAHMMDEEFNKHIHEIDKLEQGVCPNVIFAELAYLPVISRAANVVLSYNLRQYEIVMGTNSSKDAEHTIPITDLMVGVDSTGFYLRSKSLDKEVIVVTSHMLNITQVPNVYRFLRELTQERQRNIEMFQWGDLESLPYLPRVRYGRCIISPARWQLNKYVAALENDMNEKEWIVAFRKYCREWNVPRYVYYTQTENRLLLDLEQEEHVEKLRKEYMQESSGTGITLTEMGNTWEALLKSENGSYFTEFIFPIVKNKSGKLREVINGKPQLQENTSKRLKLPGSDWLYVKWYGVQDHDEEFLCGAMEMFCQMAEQQKWAKRSFFMRYADPEFHIRLRFQGDPVKLQTELLPQLQLFTENCWKENLISRLVIDTYDPEIERYGGPKLIGSAEEWFCTDSRIVAEWIRLFHSGEPFIDRDILAVISVLNIMEQFGLTFSEQFESLDHIVDYKDYLDLFRANRSLFMKLGDAGNRVANLKDYPWGTLIVNCFRLRSNVLQSYGQRAASMVNHTSWPVNRNQILYSLIHMHLNRLYGIDRNDETRILTLARHTLYNLKYLHRRNE